MTDKQVYVTLGIVLAVAGSALVGLAYESAPPALDLGGKQAARVEPLRTGEILELAPLTVLPSALETETARIQRMLEDNEGSGRIQEGFSRSLGTSHRVVLSADMLSKGLPVETHQGMIDVSADGGLVFMMRVDIPGAYAARLHLTEVDLPKQARLWVYGAGQPAVPFDLRMLRSSGDLWCPAVDSSEIWLEVEIPGSVLDPSEVYGFVVAEIGEIFAPELVGLQSPDAKISSDFSCLRDAACEDLTQISNDLEHYHTAVAHLKFIEDTNFFICSGALLTDVDVDGFIPYLLTANHCFSTQDTASTVTAYFDYRTPACGDPEPSVFAFPAVSGATWLASSANSDFTLVRLASSPPAPRAYLGWTTADLTEGTTLYRLSHPDGRPQAFSRAQYRTFGTYTCGDAPRPQFLYSEHDYGNTWGGSSGAPVVIATGQVVGQLLGKCGPDGFADCDNTVAALDGAFTTTYPNVQQWLYPNAIQECIESITLGGSANGTLSSSCESTHRSGRYARYYTFSLSSATEVQIDLESGAFDPYVILLSGTGPDGSQIASNDDISQTNRNSRISRTLNPGSYTIEATSFDASTTGPFTVRLSAPVEPCVSSSTTMCLSDDRFKVTASYRTDQGESGNAGAVELTGDTGYFWFFNQSNVEVVVKVLDACSFSDKFWVFAAGLTNVEVDIEIVDTEQGVTWSRQNPLGTPFEPIQDTSAFLTCP